MLIHYLHSSVPPTNAVMNDKNCRAPGAKHQIMYKQLLAQLQCPIYLPSQIALVFCIVYLCTLTSLLSLCPIRFQSTTPCKWVKDEEQTPGQYMVTANRVRPVVSTSQSPTAMHLPPVKTLHSTTGTHKLPSSPCFLLYVTSLASS